jgi:hypothetical protein
MEGAFVADVHVIEVTQRALWSPDGKNLALRSVNENRNAPNRLEIDLNYFAHIEKLRSIMNRVSWLLFQPDGGKRPPGSFLEV